MHEEESGSTMRKLEMKWLMGKCASIASLLCQNFVIFIRIRSRNAERVEKSRPSATQAEKIGYVSRNNVSTMKASGYSSTSRGRGKGKDEELDEESRQGLEKIKANDAEIDAGIAEISRTLDSIGGIASLMKEEVFLFTQHSSIW